MAMAVNPVSGDSNWRRQRSELHGEHHLGACRRRPLSGARSRSLSARWPKVRFCRRCVEERDPGEERCATVPVMFWQNGLTMRSVPRDSTNSSSATSPPATATKCSRRSIRRSGRRSSSRRRHGTGLRGVLQHRPAARRGRVSSTEKIFLSTIVDCYRRSPWILLTQELLTLDHGSHGQVMMAIGTGENKQFLPYGLERTEPRNAHLEEAIRIVKPHMRTTQPVTEPDNRFWKLNRHSSRCPPSTRTPAACFACGRRPAPDAGCVGAWQTGLLACTSGYADQVTSSGSRPRGDVERSQRRDRDPKSFVIGAGRDHRPVRTTARSRQPWKVGSSAVLCWI